MASKKFMSFTIVVSKADVAGMNFRRLFLEKAAFKATGKTFDGNEVLAFRDFELLTLNEFQIFAEHLRGWKNQTDCFVFASRHASESKKPTLSVHAIGNWGKDNSHGGKAREIVPASGSLMKNYLRGLQAQKEKGGLAYDVCLEATHHGPFLEKPCVFIELGSSEGQWNDLRAAEAVVETVLNESFSGEGQESPRTGDGSPSAVRSGTFVGLGGGHYCPEFSKLLLETPFCVSHVCPKYNLQNFDGKMLEKSVAAVECAGERFAGFLFDEKGMGTEKARVLKLVQESGFTAKGVREILA
ncbi:MAG: hypothetical protein HY394_00675 [Candidatus Diapherotrites archaeon]|nr:hypothetical protein [Candidatus Diapherotrites archaeon]